MKLYLASKHVQFPDELAALVGKDPELANVKLVANAFDNYPVDRREMHVANLLASLKVPGWNPSMLDLREYFGKSEALQAELVNTDLLWISGGNVFYLRYVLKQCGLDDLLAQLIGSGMVYGGDSAGAAILGPDLHGFELLDDASEAPEVLYDGLGITPFMILPHWGNERYADEIANCRKILEVHNSEIVAISDEQACIVNDSQRQILG